MNHDEASDQKVFDAAERLMQATIEQIHGVPGVSAGATLARLPPRMNVLSLLSACVGFAKGCSPHPDGSIARADYEPRLDRHYSMTELHLGEVRGNQMFAALDNQDWETALSLWLTVAPCVCLGEMPCNELPVYCLYAVLSRSADIIIRHEEEAPSDS